MNDDVQVAVSKIQSTTDEVIPSPPPQVSYGPRLEILLKDICEKLDGLGLTTHQVLEQLRNQQK
jgi:hypothetical protein